MDAWEMPSDASSVADFTNSGRLDLYVSNCAHGKKGDPKADPAFSNPNVFFRNDGGGKFTDISQGDRDRIARYLMRRQLEMRRRGLL